MGTVGVTTLHPRGSGNLELPPLTEVVSHSSEDSSRMVCIDGDPLCTIPMNTVPESFPLGERLKLLKWLVVNSKLPKHMILVGVSPTSVRLLPSATKVIFGD
jgi:hypothetical protein